MTLLTILRGSAQTSASGSAVVSGGGALTVTGRKGAQRAVAVSGGGLVTVTTSPAGRSAATVSGGGNLTVTGRKAGASAATISGGGTLTVTDRKGARSAAITSGGGTVAVTASRAQTTATIAHIADGSDPAVGARCKGVARGVPSHDLMVYGGDVYSSGTLQEFNNGASGADTNGFDHTYGDNALAASPNGQNILAKMAYVPGNHEYRTADANRRPTGANSYWTGGAPARTTRSYTTVDLTKTDASAVYSDLTGTNAQLEAASQWSHAGYQDIAGWRVLWLDTGRISTADEEGHFPTSGNYYDWVAGVVNAITDRRLIVFTHFPKWTNGGSHPESTTAGMTALWQLIAPKAAAFIVGHNHCYERQNPRNAAGTVVSQSQGCVPITNGAGGRSLNAFGTGYSPAGAINVENATLFGFLKLALSASSCVVEFWSCGTDGLQTPSVFDTVTLLANNVHTATVSGGGALTVAGRKGARRATTVAGGGALTVTTTSTASSRSGSALLHGGGTIAAAGRKGARSGGTAPATPLWQATYETNDFTEWTEPEWFGQRFRAFSGGSPVNDQSIVTDRVKVGSRAARFELQPGWAHDQDGTSRSELVRFYWYDTFGRELMEGDDLYFGWWVYLDPGMPNETGKWALFTQWKQDLDGSPPLELDCGADARVGGVQQIDLREGVSNDVYWREPITKGAWLGFIVRVYFSRDAAVGFVEVWRDNGAGSFVKQTMENGQTKTFAATLRAGADSYFKQGYYRDPTHAGSGVLWVDQTTVDPSFETVLSHLTGSTGGVTISGGGAIAATGTAAAARGGSALLHGGGNLTATGRKGARKATSVTGGGTVTVTVSAMHPRSGAAAITGRGTLTATGRKGARVAVTVHGGGALTTPDTSPFIIAPPATLTLDAHANTVAFDAHATNTTLDAHATDTTLDTGTVADLTLDPHRGTVQLNA
jgi:hypothetical protein